MSVTLPESLESIVEYAFYNCVYLAEVSIPANVTRIEIFAFRKCFELKSVEFVYYYGWYVGEEKLSVSELTANPADSLTLVYYSKIWTRDVNAEPEFADPNVFAGGACNPFTKWQLTYVDKENSTKLKLTITGNGNMPKYGTGNAPWYEYLNEIVEIEVGEGVTEIGRCSFYGLKFVTKVTLPEGLVNINEFAFNGCYSLKSVVIPASVKKIEANAFSKTALNNVEFEDAAGWTTNTKNDKEEFTKVGDVLAEELEDNSNAANSVKTTYASYHFIRVDAE